MNSYGYMLEIGEGGPVDRVAAELWYRRALDAGMGLAGLNLAYMVAGEGAAIPDHAQAWALCRRALPLVEPRIAVQWKDVCGWVRAQSVR